MHTAKPTDLFFDQQEIAEETANYHSAMFGRISSELEARYSKDFGDRIRFLEAEVERLTKEIRKAYRDRAVRDAALAADWDGVMVVGGDQAWPDWGVFYYTLSSGQVSSHIHPDELFLFQGFPHGEVNLWDGHSRDEAHLRFLQHASTRLALWDAEGSRLLDAPKMRHRRVGGLVLPVADCD